MAAHSQSTARDACRGATAPTRRACWPAPPLAPWLAGCGSAGGRDLVTAAAPMGEIAGTIEYTQMSGDPSQQHVFEKKYPKTKVNLLVPPQGQAYEAMVLAMSAAGTPPDVVYVNNDQVAQFTQTSIIEPLDPYIKRDKVVAADFSPVALRVAQLDGKQMAMPGSFNPTVIYINRTLFEQAGVSLPPRDYKDSTWTHDALLETAKKLTRTNANGQQQFGFAVDNWVGRWFPFLWGNGGDAFDSTNNPKKFTFVSPQTEQTIQWLADLKFKHRVAPQPADLAETNANDRFTQGRLAVRLELAGFVRTLSRVDGLQWEAIPVTRGPAGRFTRLAGGANGIAAKSDKKAVAWEFIKFLDSLERWDYVDAAARASTPFLSANRKVLSQPWFMEAYAPSVRAVWRDLPEYGRTQPLHAKWQELMEGEGARTHYEQALDNKISVQSALEAIRQHADAVLR